MAFSIIFSHVPDRLQRHAVHFISHNNGPNVTQNGGGFLSGRFLFGKRNPLNLKTIRTMAGQQRPDWCTITVQLPGHWCHSGRMKDAEKWCWPYFHFFPFYVSTLSEELHNPCFNILVCHTEWTNLLMVIQYSEQLILGLFCITK